MSDEKIDPLGVDNVDFMVERLYADCSPIQFVRELFQNSIESIQAILVKNKDYVGKIWIGPDPSWMKTHGTVKLCFADNGTGMTPHDMKKYINHLAACGRVQGMAHNYGIGAKISTIPANPFGVVYCSWVSGDGYLVRAIKDGHNYGLYRHKLASGEYDTALPVTDDFKVPIIEKCGTKVTLLGKNFEDNTTRPPQNSGFESIPSRWLSKYLNTRFYEVDSRINVIVVDDNDKNRTITGQKDFLENNSESSGRVKLSSSTAHWWILRPGAYEHFHGHYGADGHTAVLYQNELFDHQFGRGISARLQQFGVTFGWRRVVIYVEPDTNVGNMTTNAARTKVLINGSDVPWGEWAYEFRSLLPAEIKALITSSMPKENDRLQNIKDRLKDIMDFFKLSRYRINRGDKEVDPTDLVLGVIGTEYPIHGDGTRGGRNRGGNPGDGTETDLFSTFEKVNGIKGEKVKWTQIPEAKWVSVGDGTRDLGFMEDRAANFSKENNLLYLNADFRGFVDVVDFFYKEYEKASGPDVARRCLISDIVKQWYAQMIIESVLGTMRLEGSKMWPSDKIEAALSEESLTAVAMQRYHLVNAVKREVHSKCGKLMAGELS